MNWLTCPAIGRGRFHAFPSVWVVLLAVGVGLREPVLTIGTAAFLSLDERGRSETRGGADQRIDLDSNPTALHFIRDDAGQPGEAMPYHERDGQAHGRFAAPGNAVRRQVRLRAINPQTADELADLFRGFSYTLTDIRQGEAVPPIGVERVPGDLASKDGNERKALFISALLPVVLEVNQRILDEREQLMTLRLRLMEGEGLSPIERIWLELLAERYDTSSDRIDELVRRVDIVPPSMAIAQGGVESGWGTSFAARTGNALFGQIQTVGRHSVAVPWKPGPAMPQPFASVGEAAEAYVINLNTHPAYAAFRAERAAMRGRGDAPTGYHLVGQLLRYSELGHGYVRFVRLIMRENALAELDNARLSGF